MPQLHSADAPETFQVFSTNLSPLPAPAVPALSLIATPFVAMLLVGIAMRSRRLRGSGINEPKSAPMIEEKAL